MTLPLGSPQSGGVMKSSAWGALGPIRKLSSCPPQGGTAVPSKPPDCVVKGLVEDKPPWARVGGRNFLREGVELGLEGKGGHGWQNRGKGPSVRMG